MKAWITGSRGFIGSALVKLLSTQNFRVTCITNSSPSQQEGAVYVNYESRESIRSALVSEGIPDVLFHLGWGNMDEPQSQVHLSQNVFNTKNLMDELYQNGLKKFILIGSSSEYGSREGCLTEDDPIIGRLTNYALGKIRACIYGFEAASKHGKIFIHVRLSYVLGANHRQSSLINQLYKSACDSTILNLSPCDQFRDYIYISDAVEGMATISNINSSEIINLGSGTKILLRELVNMFWKELGASPELLKFGAHKRPSHEQEQPPCYVNLEKLRRLTGWHPNVPIREAVSRTIDALKARSI